MAIKRPTPKKLSVEESATIIQASAAQTGMSTVVKSYDPNFPVFDVPIDQKLLVYIPNHRVENPDGTVGLRMDKFAAHPVIDGRSYGNIRCTSGVVIPSLNLDGSCPLCDSIGKCWDLYNKQYDDIAKSKGIDKDAPEAKELLKQDRMDLVKSMAVKQAEVWYTFPIVVITCEEKDGQLTLNPKLTEDGKLQGTPMWYSIRENTFNEKWGAGYDALDTSELGEVPTSPAGLWAILNFTYTIKSGKHDKMGSAKALKVSFKVMGEKYAQWEQYFDQITEEWTPEKAMETVVLDVLRDMEETQEVADSVMKPVNEKLAMYALAGAGVSAQPAHVSANAAGALESFGVAQPKAPTADVPAIGEMPNVGIE
jgi:hypothetical protein